MGAWMGQEGWYFHPVSPSWIRSRRAGGGYRVSLRGGGHICMHMHNISPLLMKFWWVPFKVLTPWSPPPHLLNPWRKIVPPFGEPACCGVWPVGPVMSGYEPPGISPFLTKQVEFTHVHNYVQRPWLVTYNVE